ncbi:MAG: lantibiotic dehydratase, partial [Longimicrobiales bacterium]
MARNPAIDLVIDSLRTQETSTINSLADALVSNTNVEASSDEATTYLDHLMSLGLLQPDMPGLANRPDWTTPMGGVLATIENSPVAATLLEFLIALDGALAAIKSAPVGARDEPLAGLEGLIQGSFDQWYPVRTPAPRPPLFEDASANCTLAIDRDHFGVALRELEDLLTLLTPVAWMRREPLQLRRFFEERFSAPSVPLLTFYEVYYREVVKPGHDSRTDPALAPDQQAADDPSPDQTETTAPSPTAKSSAPPYPPEVQAIRNAHRRITQLIGKRWKAAGRASEVYITRKDIEDLTQGVAPRPADPMSFSVFTCLVPRPGESEGGMIVAPGARGYSGFGKYFSRFLYLLPQNVLDDLRRQHECGVGLVLAEIAGDQAFNANLRPPIRSTEISYPSGDRVGCD